ncbi:MAG: hypothetical protein JWR83_2652 [Aeromicrobium sp.]|nr:hypothetical protein [Aeromicrobium sp.]
MRRRLALLVLLLSLVGCGGGGGTVDVPKGVTFRVEQARQDLQNRNFEMQIVNRSAKPITVSRVELTSSRLKRASIYHGPATIGPGATTNLTFAMSKASCGTGIDATATVRYQVGSGDPVTSVVHPKDHYGSVALFMKRDCAESTLAKVAIDRKFTVEGKGANSALVVGVTFTPKPGAGAVRVGPLDGTTLLKPQPGSNLDDVVGPGSAPQHSVVKIIPNRCDVHVVAEDRTGATMPLHVDSKESGKAFFYLKFNEAQKTQIFDFIANHCGFGTKQDPLNAP